MKRSATADASVAAMRDYYARRAPHYERIYHRPERQADLRTMESWLAAAFAGRDVLEIACGTGWWTPHGARHAASWLATDLDPGTMAVARAKALPECVSFAAVDAYTLDGLPQRPFSGLFAGCWWSHVPLARLAPWLQSLHDRLAPGARVAFLDNAFVAGSSTPIARRDADGNGYQWRALDDGSVHEVLKNFPRRDEALACLGPRARDCEWIAHTHYWMLSYTLAR
jgi:demethylmenaquinone methyltransferase/2-methoxy-6-polyprenyl-1,4-benzoquinol methylase